MTGLPRLLPLEEAAQRTGLDIETLREMVAQGKVVAGISPEGGILVAVQDGKVVMLNGQANGNGEGDVFELNRRLAAIKREQFAHLEGKGITVSEAAERYNVGERTIRHWLKLYPSFLRVIDKGRPKRLNEADVAFLAAIHHLRKQFGVRSGTPLIDAQGNPKLIRLPHLSQYRRLKREVQAVA